MSQVNAFSSYPTFGSHYPPSAGVGTSNRGVNKPVPPQSPPQNQPTHTGYKAASPKFGFEPITCGLVGLGCFSIIPAIFSGVIGFFLGKWSGGGKNNKESEE
jgi:hypothetical protein